MFSLPFISPLSSLSLTKVSNIFIKSYNVFPFLFSGKIQNQMDDVASNERRIIVAVDEGDESMYALSWCLKNVIADNYKDTLILLYAKPPRQTYTALDGSGERVRDRGGSFGKSTIKLSSPEVFFFSLSGICCNFGLRIRVFVLTWSDGSNG